VRGILEGMKTQDRVLAYLKENRNDWVSGQWLSRKLAMSRTAVNKHVQRLKLAGYPIETSTRKGYFLGDVPDLLRPDEIREGLETRIFGPAEIHYLPKLDSTNKQAGVLAAAGAPEGTMVVADTQLQGKGRKGRPWFSPEGTGVYLSLILRPAMPPSKAPVVTLMAGVAVAETLLCLTELDAKIKWPNDILVNNRKIAGILTEISTDMDSVGYIIVGIGMNVNTTRESFQAEGHTEATSILMETGAPFPRIKVIKTFLNFFETYYTTLQTEGFEPILKRWKGLAGMMGRKIRVAMVGDVVTGTAVDIDREGVLILRDDKGEYHRIVSGDVELIED